MDSYVFLTHQAVRSLDGLTAFSALPDAPVLPYTPRRRRLPTGVADWRVRQRRPAHRLASANSAGNACA